MPVSEKDYLQVFNLSTWFQLGLPKLTIHHKQECPEYSQTHVLDIDHVIHEKVFIIDDGTHCTMLLAEEYWVYRIQASNRLEAYLDYILLLWRYAW